MRSESNFPLFLFPEINLLITEQPAPITVLYTVPINIIVKMTFAKIFILFIIKN